MTAQESLFKGWHIRIIGSTPEQETVLQKESFSFLEYLVRPSYPEEEPIGQEVIEAYIVYPRPVTRPAHAVKEITFVNEGLSIVKRCIVWLRGPYVFGKTPKQELKYDMEDAITKLKNGVFLEQIQEENPFAWKRAASLLTELRHKFHKVRNVAPVVTWFWGEPKIMQDYLLSRQVRHNIFIKRSESWEGYDQQPVLMIKSFLEYTAEQLADLLTGWSCTVPVEGKTIQLNSPIIYFFSKNPPVNYYPDNSATLLRRLTFIHQVNKPDKDVKRTYCSAVLPI